MRCCVVLSLLLAVAPFARAGEQDEVPTYQNPQMEHVTVESAMPKEYLSICPNVCELADGSLLIAYHRIGYVDWTGGFSSFTRISRDGGKTWSDAHLFAKDIQAPGLVRLRSGDLLLNGCQFVSEHFLASKNGDALKGLTRQLLGLAEYFAPGTRGLARQHAPKLADVVEAERRGIFKRKKA